MFPDEVAWLNQVGFNSAQTQKFEEVHPDLNPKTKPQKNQLLFLMKRGGLSNQQGLMIYDEFNANPLTIDVADWELLLGDL